MGWIWSFWWLARWSAAPRGRTAGGAADSRYPAFEDDVCHSGVAQQPADREAGLARSDDHNWCVHTSYLRIPNTSPARDPVPTARTEPNDQGRNGFLPGSHVLVCTSIASASGGVRGGHIDLHVGAIDQDVIDGRPPAGLLDQGRELFGGIALDEVHPNLPARASPSTSPTAPPATRAARSTAACRPTSSRSRSRPTSTASSSDGLVAADWADDAEQGHGHGLGRRARRPQGQPEEHQHLGRPAQARASRCSRPTRSPRAARMEPDGRLRRAAQAGQGPAGRRSTYLEQLITKHVKVQDKSGARGAAGLRRGNGDVLHLLRERGDHRPAEGRGGRLRHPRPDDPDREPDRRRRRSPSASPRPKAFVDYRSPRPPSSRSPTRATGRSTRRWSRRTRRSSRRRKGLFTIDDLGGWDKVNDDFFDPDKGSVAKIEQAAGVSTAK